MTCVRLPGLGSPFVQGFAAAARPHRVVARHAPAADVTCLYLSRKGVPRQRRHAVAGGSTAPAAGRAAGPRGLVTLRAGGRGGLKCACGGTTSRFGKTRTGRGRGHVLKAALPVLPIRVLHRPERCSALLSQERRRRALLAGFASAEGGCSRRPQRRITWPAGDRGRSCQEPLSPGKNGRNWGAWPPNPQAERLSRKKCDKGNELRYVGAPAMGRPSLKGCSSIGRASVSKTEGWGFETLRPCQVLVCAH